MSKTIHRPEYGALRAALRELRRERGITQVELAKALGRSQAFVSEVERGSRRLDAIELRDFCEVLGTTVSRFFGDLERQFPSGVPAATRRATPRTKPRRER